MTAPRRATRGSTRELLRDGDRRNVADRYRYWRLEAIVADLDRTRHRFHVAIENWEHDFNIGSVVRTANAFNAAAFHIVGRRRWNRRSHGDRPVPARVPPPGRRGAGRLGRGSAEGVASEAVWVRATPGVAVGGGIPGGVIPGDGIPGRRHTADRDRQCPRSGGLGDLRPARDCVLVFGQEGPGLTPAMQQVCQVVLHIEQFGSTARSTPERPRPSPHAWVAATWSANGHDRTTHPQPSGERNRHQNVGNRSPEARHGQHEPSH